MPADQPPRERDVVVVGAGIVGLAVARELALRHDALRVEVLEREPGIAAHQTSHSSGVIHAGIYYLPGSLKARLCVAGARELYAYCDERNIPARRTGKLIVATEAAELDRLAELERRGAENGVPGLRRLGAGELREVEPHVTGIAGLHSPATGVVDFARVAAAYAGDVGRAGGGVSVDCAVDGISEDGGRRGGSPPSRDDAGAGGGRVRRGVVGPAGGRGGRAGGAPHRALPRQLPPPASRTL